MNTAQMLYAFAATTVALFGAYVLISWVTIWRDDRAMRREFDKARHPSMRQRSDVRLLRLTIDDFNGCDDCFTGWHGVKENGRCLCCGFDLPASYPSDHGGEFAGYRKI
jgi:hypothetical protein